VLFRSIASNGVSFTVVPTAAITSLSPSSGAVSASVTITGTNFGATQGTSTVAFNGTTTTPTSWAATSIVVPVPAGATTGNVTITVGGVASNGVNFTVVPTASITSLSPTSGAVSASVTITGTNFGATQGTSSVKFNGTTATPTSWAATSIVVPVPVGATTGNVTVTVGSVASNGVNFTVVPTASITSLSPTSGAVGATVTITGTNFGATQGTSTVKFNGTTATPTSWAATSIVTTVPTGTTTGNVIVTVGGVASNPVVFTLVTSPAITSLSPTTGIVGTAVTITGTNFGATKGTSTVTFNGTTATPTSWSPTSIVVPVPSGATTGNVSVTVGGMTGTGPTFTLDQAPVVTNPGTVTVGANEAYAQTVAGDTPVAYWRLDELTGTSARDSVGTSDGTLLGGITRGQPGALVNGNAAMLVDGVDGTRVAVPNTTALGALNGSAALTLETWMNPATVTLPSHYGLFYTFPGDGRNYVGLDNWDGTPRLIVSLMINGAQRTFTAGPVVTVGTWYHVVVTYDGATLVLYVNGVAVGQVAANGPVNLGTSGLLLGGYSSTGGYGFSGVLDEPAIYGHALTATQVATHYAQRLATTSTPISVQIVASDPDGDALTYSATGLPAGLSINATTGVISGTVTAPSGNYLVTVTVSDGLLSTSQAFTWTVPSGDQAPSVANPGSVTLASSEAYTQTVTGHTPVAYWRLDELTGTSARDRMGVSSGALQGGITRGQSGALVNGNAAMVFDGIDGTRVAVPNTTALSALNGGGALTLETWMNPATVTMPSHYRLFYTFPGDGRNYVGLNNWDGTPRLIVSLMINGTQRTFTAGPIITAGTWYHVVVTYDGATLVLYVNSVAVGQLAASGPVNLGTAGLLLGGYLSTGGYGFNGTLDEPAIYGQALTAAQVATHYAQRLAMTSTPIALQITATDPSGKALTYSATGLPAGLSINATTGMISGTVTAAAGSYPVTVTVSNGSLSSSQTFTWTVPQADRPASVVNPGAVTTAVSEAYAQTVTGDTPVAYWRLDGASGASARDSVGTNDGTLQGGITRGQPGALVNGNAAILVDGVDGTRVAVSATSALNALNGSTALTLETWMNPATVTMPSHYRLFYSFPGDGRNYVGLNDWDGTPRMIVSLVINGTQRVFAAGPVVAAGTWYHIVVTYDGTVLVLYVDGVAVGQVAASGPVSLGTSGLLLGGYPSMGGYGFNGVLDETAIYAQALTATQVATHYAQRLATTPTPIALQIAASDPDGNALTYTASGLPAGLSIDATTGLISGTLSPASAGTTSTVTVTASDGWLSTNQTFTWTVPSMDQAPVVMSPGTVTLGPNEAYAVTVAGDLPTGYWRLGELSGLTTSDLAGMSAGNIQGGITLGQAGALANGNAAMLVDGSDGTRVSVPNTTTLSTLSGSGALTLEAWMNPATVTMPSQYRLFYSFPGDARNYLGLYNSAGTPRLIVSLVINGVQQVFVAGPVITAGSWYHVVVTYDGAAIVLYVNGVAVGQVAANGPVGLGSGGLLLGGYTTTGGYGFSGVLDEAAIYGHALTATQVATHYAQRFAMTVTPIALQITATDPDGDALTYSATGLPAGLSINTTTGVISEIGRASCRERV